MTVQSAFRDADARRSLLIQGAVAVFAERGFAGASVRELAAGAGMEKGHLTYYFPSKQDLLFLIIDELHRAFIGSVDEWVARVPLGDEGRLTAIFTGHARTVFDRHAEIRVAYENLRFLSPPRRRAVIKTRDRYEIRLAEEMEACRGSGVVMSELSTSILTKVVLGILNWPYQWFSPDGLSADDLGPVLAERALASLRPSLS